MLHKKGLLPHYIHEGDYTSYQKLEDFEDFM